MEAHRQQGVALDDVHHERRPPDRAILAERAHAVKRPAGVAPSHGTH
jgi:hypothetical protein